MALSPGLSSSAVAEALQKFGYNEIPEKKASLLEKLAKQIVSVISVMLCAASGLSFFEHRTFDGYFILALLALNIGVSLWQELKADKAISQLNAKLTATVKVLRDGTWQRLPSRELVPNDVIELAGGQIIPVDGTIVDAKNVSVNESALTGESLPKEKKPGDSVFSGSFLITGIATITVKATGAYTSFGKTILSVETSKTKSNLEKDIIRISQYLSLLSITGVIVLSLVLLSQKVTLVDIVTLDVSLLIAGIPISLATVMTLIIAVGIIELSKKQVIIRRLSALEDLANVNLLLTDKTGTLTKNEISVTEIVAFGSLTKQEVLHYAALASPADDQSPITQAIRHSGVNLLAQSLTLRDFTPADSNRKRATAVYQDHTPLVVSLGAPQVIFELCNRQTCNQNQFLNYVNLFAAKGYRTLALAIGRNNTQENNLTLAGLIALSDDVRPEAAQVIDFLKQNGITMAILTGDNTAITREVAYKLGIPGNTVLNKRELDSYGIDSLPEYVFHKVAAFAEILPSDKLQLVKHARRFFVVATNGDGINDLPAIKAANVGIAVKNAVDAVKSAADIVLLSDGIGVITDAIVESQRIFARLYSYSMYRISESFRLIVTIVVLGVLYHTYPLTPLQLILIALLNDIPIISLAFDNVRLAHRPAKINVKKRFVLSSIYGTVGVANSLILFYFMASIFHLPWPIIQTMYFLKLTVSGHLLIYITRTSERWWKFLPSKQVILATTITQLAATNLALTGWFMPAKIPLLYVVLVWLWAIFWMQVSEVVKVGFDHKPKLKELRIGRFVKTLPRPTA